MGDYDRVRVLVVGDSGVGKTALTTLISQGTALTNPGWTVGCSVEVKLHEYLEGTPNQRMMCIELWDIGGSHSHRNTRHMFYSTVHGIILVHDLSNRKSCLNLNRWLAEVTRYEAGTGKYNSNSAWEGGNISGSDIGEVDIPLLVVGTKADVASERTGLPTHQKRSDIAEEYGTEEIHLNCNDNSGFAAGSSAATKLTRFFDKVIERQLTCRERKASSASSLGSHLGSSDRGSSSSIFSSDRRRADKHLYQEKSPYLSVPQ